MIQLSSNCHMMKIVVIFVHMFEFMYKFYTFRFINYEYSFLQYKKAKHRYKTTLYITESNISSIFSY